MAFSLSVSSIDELFALPPSEFVAARDGLAKRLRAEGDRDGAQQVRELRRPTVPAWAVNQLVRQDPAAFDRLLAVGSELQEAQRQALSGSRDAGLREATTRRRELIDDLTDRAAGLLADSGTNPDPHRDAIAATLEAATLDGDAAEKVRSGRLSKELPPPAGFGDLGGFVVVDEPEPPPSKSKDDRAERRAEARRAAKLAQERADEAERAAGEARREAEAQMRSAQKALEKADRVRQEADQLADEARQARERLADLSD